MSGCCNMTAMITDGSDQTATTTANITSPITLTPASVQLHAIGTQSLPRPSRHLIGLLWPHRLPGDTGARSIRERSQSFRRMEAAIRPFGAIDAGTSTLHAVNARNIANLLYSGTLSGGAIRWTVPAVVNGNVYVGRGW
jgi:hypothetical protein